MLLGRNDKHCSVNVSREAYTLLPSKDKSISIIKGARHDLLLEVSAPHTITKMLEWLNHRTRSFDSCFYSTRIRDGWIAKQLQIREKEFTVTKKHNIVIGTWNVNSKRPVCSLHKHVLIS